MVYKSHCGNGTDEKPNAQDARERLLDLCTQNLVNDLL